MEFADRLGVVALIMTFIGLGITILWPTQRWIGWISIAIALVLGGWWGRLEWKKPHHKPESVQVVEKSDDVPKETTAKVQHPPRIEVGFALGAENVTSGETADSHIHSYSEKEIQGLTFDLDTSHWARVIYRVKNLGEQTLRSPTIQIEANNTRVHLDHGGKREPERLPGYLLQYVSPESLDLLPYSLSKSHYAVPVDITAVALDVRDFNLIFKIFGTNMEAHIVTTHFHVVRSN